MLLTKIKDWHWQGDSSNALPGGQRDKQHTTGLQFSLRSEPGNAEPWFSVWIIKLQNQRRQGNESEAADVQQSTIHNYSIILSSWNWKENNTTDPCPQVYEAVLCIADLPRKGKWWRKSFAGRTLGLLSLSRLPVQRSFVKSHAYELVAFAPYFLLFLYLT